MRPPGCQQPHQGGGSRRGGPPGGAAPRGTPPRRRGPGATGTVRRSALTTRTLSKGPRLRAAASHRARAVQGDEGVEVGGEKARVAALATSGVEPDLAAQRGHVEVAEVHLGELGVLVAHVVEGVPLVAEALEGPRRRGVGRRPRRREVEIALAGAGTGARCDTAPRRGPGPFGRCLSASVARPVRRSGGRRRARAVDAEPPGPSARSSPLRAGSD